MSADLSQMRDPLGLLRLGYAAPLLDVRARHWHDGESEERDERVAEETPVAIVYNSVPHVVMMCTPIDLEDFALGFSITEELIRAPDDMRSIQVVRYSQGIEIQTEVSAECEATIASRDRRLTGRTGCGICGADTIAAVLKTLHPVTSRVPVSGAAIARAMREMCERQPLNAAAGAVHAAGWADADGTVALVREDVGRHNALDKLIGAMLAARMDASAGFAVVTSRASFEMVQKATVLGAPLLAAISGPTGLAVRVAQQAGLTLVGFARGGKLTVYTHPDRVIA
ncbi:MAG TPA: formate dehydrogenase accessory sulfurtransferase FdhD [Gemmatimonadaceae bacterium]|nr:formate dehydrogenase accessory sulfurtransferase FdhD [Gemmatimonadaceae bacterium]